MAHAGDQLGHKSIKSGQIAPKHNGPRLVAVGVTSPDNIGMLFRIADAVGVRQLVLIDTPAVNNRKVRRVARHCDQYVPYTEIAVSTFLTNSQTWQPLIALEITSTSEDIYKAEIPEDITLVVGNEQHGIPPKVLAVCGRAVHIPMMGQNSSMNVATAAGIALYEWHRRFR